jgi:hypothetical protein
MGLGERARVAVRGFQKDWPVGIVEAADYPAIALLEGAPDFLTAHYLALWEQAGRYSWRGVQCAPVAMLSPSDAIAPEALPYFAGRHVRIFPHCDAEAAGLQRAGSWQQQLLRAGAARVDLFDFSSYRQADGQPVTALWEFVQRLHPDDRENRNLEKILP